MKHAISIIAAGVFALPLSAVGRQQSGPLQVREATIAQIESELKARRLTCHSLVQAYLTRIDAFDKKGPSLNAIVEVNPEALKEADNLDRRFASSGLVGPLHCVPMIVKDNFETIGLQSAAGSLAMKGFVSTKDAFLVRRVFSPTTGFPAINVPMGYTRDGTLPAGMTLFSRAWDESKLIALAFSYEQSTHHRRPPESTPPVR